MSKQPVTKTAPTPAVVHLSPQKLDIARELAQEGNREHTIRRALGLTPAQWRRLKEDSEEGDLSPLALALEEGRAEGAGEIVAFMKNKMQAEGDIRAAEWLADRIYKINKGDGNGDDAPRVLIQINAALSPEDYGRAINVQQDQ
ncbi:hypothetical protein [uncultured Alcanivorax sp.]|jgi:hypothetical protein|uniref:hypothetical protein n=1 Tax=uncultured Alcanivorax sp. TaxID=191215 RepID=UPI0025F6B995|nr:hypothetical protein [uncultured Alcanivorax sp.]